VEQSKWKRWNEIKREIKDLGNNYAFSKEVWRKYRKEVLKDERGYSL